MTQGLPPTGPGGPQIPGEWQPQDEARAPEPQMRGPLAPRPEGWEPPPRRSLEERDRSIRARLGKLGGPLALIGLLIWKIGRWALILLGKVALLFKIPLLGTVISGGVSIVAYTVLWGWTFAVAIMVSLLVHELGHVVQIKREGMPVKALNFVPFLGAYVMSDAARNPEQQARISIAGPLAGALLASAVYLVAGDHDQLRAIAFLGFYLNLLNLIPIGFLDGGGVGSVFTAGWWAIIAALLGVIAVGSGSTLAAIVGIVAAVLIYTKRSTGFSLDPVGSEIPIEQRINAAVLFVGVAAVCAFGMAASFADRSGEIVDVSSAPSVTTVATR